MIPASPDSTLTAIRLKVRRLTASPSEQSLTTATIDQAINTFYSQDFPYGIKVDQMRSVYTFFTQPFVERYPLDVNYNQGIRDPVYFEGIKGMFFKDRDQFYNMWPRWPTQSSPFSGDGVTQVFNFNVETVPFLQNEFVLGVTDVTGASIAVNDDGNGNLYYVRPNQVVLNPSYTNINPGMKNANLSTNYNPPQTYPGDPNYFLVGTVNYVTGAVSVNYAVIGITPASGTQANLWVSQYAQGRPYTMLFWNNTFSIRPVPDNVYKVEVETYLTPVQFLAVTDNPILTQWWQYLAYGAAMEIQRERNDFEGVEGLREGFKRQEALVLERQATEEIGSRNTTIFSSSIPQQGWNQGWGWPY